MQRVVTKKLSVEIECPATVPVERPRSPRVAALLRDAASQLDRREREGEAHAAVLRGRSPPPAAPGATVGPRERVRAASLPTGSVGRAASSSSSPARSLSVEPSAAFTSPPSPRMAALMREAKKSPVDDAAPQLARRARARSADHSPRRPGHGPSPLSPRGFFADDRMP